MKGKIQLGIFVALNIALFLWIMHRAPDGFEVVDRHFDYVDTIIKEINDTRESEVIDSIALEGKAFLLSVQMANLQSLSSWERDWHQRHSSYLRDFGILNCILWVGLFLYVVTRKKIADKIRMTPRNSPDG